MVVNPAAAGGRVGRRWVALELHLKARLGPVRFVHTAGPGDATRIAREAALDGADAVLAIGGDGTLGAVAAGLAGTETALGVLPAGTGGDFSRDLPHARSLLDAAESLPRAGWRLIDVGRVTCRGDDGAPWEGTFLNVAAAGINGLVDRLVNTSGRWLGGPASFTLATLRAHRRYRPACVRLRLDGEDLGAHTVSSVVVANGRFAGGGMCFAPEAKLDDGLLDVVTLPALSLARGVGLMADLRRGTHLRREDVRAWRGKRLEVELEGEAPAWMDVDGEAPGVAPASFEVWPGALRLLWPGARAG